LRGNDSSDIWTGYPTTQEAAVASRVSSKGVERIQAKAMRDDAFRRSLVRNPRKALTEEGMKIPAGVRVRVVQNSASTFHLVIPGKPVKKRGGSKGPKRPGRMGPQFTIPI